MLSPPGWTVSPKTMTPNKHSPELFCNRWTTDTFQVCQCVDMIDPRSDSPIDTYNLVRSGHSPYLLAVISSVTTEVIMTKRDLTI